MFRVSIVTKNTEFISKNFSTRDEAETFILETLEQKQVKYCRLRNTDTNEEEKIDV
jgi:hypothetical protein